MEKKSISRSAFLSLRALIALLLCASACFVAVGTLPAFLRPEARAKLSQRTLTFAERVSYQRAMEEVYWRHRIWPKENRDPKPSLDAVMSPAQLEKRVENYLRKSQLVADQRGSAITVSELQAEMDRMAQHTKEPDVLRELFEALGDDPHVIAECLARPILVEHVIAGLNAHHESLAKVLESSRDGAAYLLRMKMPRASYRLPEMSAWAECTDDTWAATTIISVPTARWRHTAVWTGSEMIVWGGYGGGNNELNTGGRYNPTVDAWTATSTTNAPFARISHTAVWTGSEVIVWGGYGCGGNCTLNTGGKYNPGTDSWTATSIVNAPVARWYHRALWSGNQMIVWGGTNGTNYLHTGGKYNPSADTWTATGILNFPLGRIAHTAGWTGSEMIVWGGVDETFNDTNTGGKYRS